jgi:hypothetical protein
MRPPSTLLRLSALVLLLGLGAAFALGPPVREDIWEWLVIMGTGYWREEEATIVALFHLMVLWPLALAGLLRDELWARPIMAWPFVVGSLAVGSFALLPWVGLSGDAGPIERKPGLVGGRGWGLLVATTGGLVLGLGAVYGDIVGGLANARAEGFVHLMAADFAALWVMSIALARRRDAGRAWLWALIPVAGLGVWMALGAPARPGVRQ